MLISWQTLAVFLGIAFVVYLLLLLLFARFVDAAEDYKRSAPVASTRTPGRATPFFAAFKIDSVTKATSGAVATFALAASAYVYFVEELRSRSAVAFIVMCSKEEQRLSIDVVTNQPIDDCTLSIWPTLLEDSTNAPETKVKPHDLLSHSFLCLQGKTYENPLEAELLSVAPDLVAETRSRKLRVRSLEATIRYSRPPREGIEVVTKDVTCQ
jgi:hypothetical protein